MTPAVIVVVVVVVVVVVSAVVVTLTWSELNKKLEAAEEEKAELRHEAANATELMQTRLQQVEDSERRLRDDIRAVEMHNLRKQHATLKTSQ